MSGRGSTLGPLLLAVVVGLGAVCLRVGWSGRSDLGTADEALAAGLEDTAIDFYASPVCVSIVDTFAAPLSNVFDTFLFSTLSSPAVSVFNGSSPWGAGYTIFVSLSVSE